MILPLVPDDWEDEHIRAEEQTLETWEPEPPWTDAEALEYGYPTDPILPPEFP